MVEAGTMRVTLPRAEIGTVWMDEQTVDLKAVASPTGGHSISFEFDVEAVDAEALRILFGIQPKRLTSKLERAVALGIVIENALVAPARYGWAWMRFNARLAASVPYILKGVKR